MPPRPGYIFLPVDVEFMENPRIDAAGERAGWLYLAMCLRAKRTLSDGRLTHRQIDRLGIAGVRPRLAALVREGLVRHHGDQIEIVGWTERNSTAAQIAAKAEAKQAAGILGNHKRWHDSDHPDPTCPHCTPPPAIAPATPDAIAPPIAPAIAPPITVRVAKTETEAETETETEDRGAEREEVEVETPDPSEVQQVRSTIEAAVDTWGLPLDPQWSST